MEIVEVKEEQPPKRIKTDETAESKGVEEEDRISALPDCLIIEILSRLPSTKYAIRTSSLSKRWTHLWLSVPTLIFLHENQSRTDFFVSVSKTLTQYHCQSKLKKFKISPWYDSRFESHVNSWIRHAVNHNVEDLCLGLQSRYIENDFVLKEDFFFASSCFTHLELDCCKFKPSGPISWKNLTSLYISFGKLDANLIQNILSGSPLLETLNLHKCYGFLRLNITSKSVKNLVLSGYIDPRSHIPARIIGIDAPNILSLVIEDDLILRKLVLLNVSSLLNIELNYTHTHGHYENTQKIKKDKILKGLLLSLRHVKQIKIGNSCYEAFFHLEAEGFKFPSKVKVLDSPQVAVWSD